MFILNILDPLTINKESPSARTLINQTRPEESLKNLLGQENLLGQTGDMNRDDLFDGKDLSALYTYLHDPLEYIELTDEQKKNVDINKDGKVNDKDFLELYTLFTERAFDDIKLNSDLKGDFNGDGTINKKDVSLLTIMINTKVGLIPKILSEEFATAADINNDGILNQDDVDKLKTKINPEEPNKLNTEPSRPVDSNLLVGDLNNDEHVDYYDVEKLGKSLNSTSKEDKLIDIPKEVSDVNKDGFVDFSDLAAIEQISRKNAFDSLKPGSTLKGDLNNDGTVDIKDEWAMLIAKKVFFYEQNSDDDDKIMSADLNGDKKVDIKDLDILRYDILKESKLDIKQFQNLPSDDPFISQSLLSIGLLNGNCGPASLAMILEKFNKISGGQKEADDLMKLMRQLMGANSSDFVGVLDDDFISGAEAVGLEAISTKGNIEDITKALKEGKQIIASVNPAKYSASPNSAHAVAITGIDGDNFIVYNPAFLKPTVLSPKELELAMADLGNHIVVIGEPSSKNNNDDEDQNRPPNAFKNNDTVEA